MIDALTRDIERDERWRSRTFSERDGVHWWFLPYPGDTWQTARKQPCPRMRIVGQ